MKTHLNTIYVTTQGAYLHKKGDTVCVDIEKQTKLRVPLHNLEGLVGFGNVMYSPFLLGACAAAGVSVSMLTRNGRFLAGVTGYPSGNILLRREQYRRSDDSEACAAIAGACIAAKIANSRHVLARSIRDHGDVTGTAKRTLTDLRDIAKRVATCGCTDSIRGMEGDAARRYFAAFPAMLTLKGAEREAFTMASRSRRPPLDRCNALLSFVYTLLMGDCRSACESVGLDSQAGFLHRPRPGRPGMALDLMEEFRPILADRLVFSLLNRKQITADDFSVRENGAVELTERGRKTVLVAWQKRKEDTIRHPYLDERMSVGLLAHIQARLLTRHLRGDLDGYPALIWE
ncbi:MAG: type I-C CRISPR-associated endonuclease Cas1c [Planctomycetota bacterium]|jgi:CRISPR-associated protein Cas1|nr:type I-C CRISPR-associated endonuclease Cas1c [Planctomycetota bacterium]